MHFNHRRFCRHSRLFSTLNSTSFYQNPTCRVSCVVCLCLGKVGGEKAVVWVLKSHVSKASPYARIRLALSSSDGTVR